MACLPAFLTIAGAMFLVPDTNTRGNERRVERNGNARLNTGNRLVELLPSEVVESRLLMTEKWRVDGRVTSAAEIVNCQPLATIGYLSGLSQCQKANLAFKNVLCRHLNYVEAIP